ncbi:MAG: glycosyltransferase [Clostridia bacterium]
MKDLKVIIASRNLITGGIESSYLNFINNVKDKVNLDAFLCNNCGALKNRLNPEIKLYEGNKIVKFFAKDDGGISNSAKSNKLKATIRKVIKFIYNKFGIKRFLKWFGVASLKKLKTDYDCAICFYAQNEICSKVVLKKIKAKQKIAVIHTDVSISPILKESLKLLYKYDKIMCVSKSCAEVFKSTYPLLASKTGYLYNFQDNEKIKTKSVEFEVNYPKIFNVVSVSRLSDEQKGVFRALKIFKKLHDSGCKFHWHIVGDGPDRQEMENYIKANNMYEYVTLYGNQVNPYPYIKSADLLVLLSYYEAAPMVYNEAQLLNTPVFTARIVSSDEMIGNLGFVCDNDENAIYESLKSVLDNPKVVEDKKHLLQDFTYDNSLIVEHLISIINNAN